MEKIVISSIKKTQIPESVELLARAYMNNPNHAAVFGRDQLESNRRLFGASSNNIKGKRFVAVSDGKVVGVIGIRICPLSIDSTGEPPSTSNQKPPIPESAVPRFIEWRSIWDKKHLLERHYHFGPVAVLPELQHRHIGSQMMEHCCKILDCEGEAGYLETETEENVKFYSKFGFTVVGKCDVLGQPNWFMKREINK